jgi:hypothetical protein
VLVASEAPDLWRAFDEIERLAAAAKVLLSGLVERSGVWRRAGCRSAAEYLARESGTTVGRAREALAAAAQAPPRTREAMRRGELSAAQAAAVATAAAADPGAEQRLLSLAGRTNLRELRDECARVRAAADPDPEAAYERVRKHRSLTTYRDADGAWCLSARGPADQGALITRALDRIIDGLYRQHRTAGTHEPRDAYAFDALTHLAAGPPTSDADRLPKWTPKYLAVLRVDHAALTRGHLSGGETCEIAGTGPVPVTVARRLLGDSILQLVITKGHDVATTVHLGRGPNTAQKIALAWTSPHCTNQACSGTHTHIDHRVDYATTRHTRLDELDRLCTHCHHLKHHQGWNLTTGTGRRAFVPPTDPRHPRNKPPP